MEWKGRDTKITAPPLTPPHAWAWRGGSFGKDQFFTANSLCPRVPPSPFTMNGEGVRGWGRRRGQSLVEFALFVSILLLLLGAVVDLGTLLSDHQAVVAASQQGALVAATLGANAGADC